MYGLQSEDGTPIKKPWKVTCANSDLCLHLNKTCSKGHTHAQCTSSELTNTQMYTMQVADVVHQCIARTALSASSPPNLAKVRPALPCIRVMPRPPGIGPKAAPKAEFKAPPVVHGPRAEPPPVAHGPRGDPRLRSRSREWVTLYARILAQDMCRHLRTSRKPRLAPKHQKWSKHSLGFRYLEDDAPFG